jgi:hypothetical protein
LILPIQRLPRYKLLIEDLEKKTSDDNVDVLKKVQMAKIAISEIVLYCNNKQKEINNSKKASELMRKLETGNEKSLKIKHSETLIDQHLEIGFQLKYNEKIIEIAELYLFTDFIVFLSQSKDQIRIQKNEIFILHFENEEILMTSEESNFYLIIKDEELRKKWVDILDSWFHKS